MGSSAGSHEFGGSSCTLLRDVGELLRHYAYSLLLLIDVDPSLVRPAGFAQLRVAGSLHNALHLGGLPISVQHGQSLQLVVGLRWL